MASKLAVYETGYEDERFQQIVSQSFHCIICTNVIKDAVMCPQNEHLFCRACITRYLMNSQKCPTCMEPLTVETLRQASRGVKNLLSELKIRCEFFDRGCEKFVELGDLERHVADCGFAPAVCSNEGCQLEVNKQDLLHHETTMCELRRVKCHSCSEIRREVETVKVSLAAMNEKLDKNEKKLSEALEKIGENKQVADNLVSGIELIRQQLNKEENNGEGEIHKTLKEITKQLERIIQKTPSDKLPSDETTSREISSCDKVSKVIPKKSDSYATEYVHKTVKSRDYSPGSSSESSAASIISDSGVSEEPYSCNAACSYAKPREISSCDKVSKAIPTKSDSYAQENVYKRVKSTDDYYSPGSSSESSTASTTSNSKVSEDPRSYKDACSFARPDEARSYKSVESRDDYYPPGSSSESSAASTISYSKASEKRRSYENTCSSTEPFRNSSKNTASNLKKKAPRRS